MLWTIILILLVLWALGFGVAGAAVGNLIHVLLVIALVVFVIQLVTGRRGAL
ncbi:MAG: lmo0937 family membrane protein [Pyrinomonadaceae bacterium]